MVANSRIEKTEFLDMKNMMIKKSLISTSRKMEQMCHSSCEVSLPLNPTIIHKPVQEDSGGWGEGSLTGPWRAEGDLWVPFLPGVKPSKLAPGTHQQEKTGSPTEAALASHRTRREAPIQTES